MIKLLVLSCLLVSCLADPFGLPSWLREAGRRHRHPQGCANRAEGWRACARLAAGEALAPHGRDCSLFFYCGGTTRPACRKCPAGLHFNPQLQVCDWPENVNCAPRAHHNGTTPSPTTPGDDATVTEIDGSPTTELPSTDTTTTELPSTEASLYELSTTEASTSTEPSVFSWQNYIPWSRK